MYQSFLAEVALGECPGIRTLAWRVDSLFGVLWSLRLELDRSAILFGDPDWRSDEPASSGFTFYLT